MHTHVMIVWLQIRIWLIGETREERKKQTQRLRDTQRERDQKRERCRGATKEIKIAEPAYFLSCICRRDAACLANEATNDDLLSLPPENIYRDETLVGKRERQTPPSSHRFWAVSLRCFGGGVDAIKSINTRISLIKSLEQFDASNTCIKNR